MADTYDFPDDLMQLRRDFHQAGLDLRTLHDDDGDQRKKLRDRERDLALQLARHPWWTAEPGRGNAKAVLQKMIADERKTTAEGDADRA